MRPLILVPLLAALLLAVACGGAEDSERAGDIIHRLFVAALTQDPGRLEGFSGKLPPDLTERMDVPLYPDADLIVSFREPVAVGDQDVEPEADQEGTPEPVLYLILLDTGDDRDRVFRVYEKLLDQDPWQLVDSYSTQEVDTLSFSKVDDADISGAVSIAHGGKDGRTTIFISLQDAGALSVEEPEFELGESLLVPRHFPADVPEYDGATVTDTAFSRAPANESFLLIFLTPDAQNQVIDFYREAFEDNGWTVEEGEVFGLEERITFRDSSGDIQGEVAADRFSLDRQLTEVTVRVQVNPAREEPEGGDGTPGSSPSLPQRTPATPGRS